MEIVFAVLRQFRVVLKQNIVSFVYEKACKVAQTHIHTPFRKGRYEDVFSQHRLCSNNVCIDKERKYIKNSNGVAILKHCYITFAAVCLNIQLINVYFK